METKKREFIDPNDLMWYINENHCYAGLPMAAHICTMELLTYAPRVDAVEVVHGRWKRTSLYDEESSVQCSECLMEFDYIDGMCYLVTGSELPFYCPNCGAKMDGGK